MTTVHNNPWFSVTEHTQDNMTWYRVTAPDSANVVATNDRGEFLMVRGRRPATPDYETYEFPGGIISPNEAAGDAVVREAREETGWIVTCIRPIGQFHQVAAISSAQCHVFSGEVSEQGEQVLDAGENWVPVFVGPTEITRLIGAGEIRDGGTLAAIALRAAWMTVDR